MKATIKQRRAVCWFGIREWSVFSACVMDGTGDRAGDEEEYDGDILKANCF